MEDNRQATTKYQAQVGYAPTLLLVYLGLAIILTWPTATHLTTHLPGDGGDDPAIAWNLWWGKYALLNEGQNPFQTDFMFYPIGLNLAFYTLTLLNAVTALPLTLNFGVVTASNLHLLFTFAAGGYGAFLLTRYVLTTTQAGKSAAGWATVGSIEWAGAAVAGGFYAFASSQLFFVALGQFNIASNHWVPFAVLYMLRTRHNPGRLKNAILAGLFLTIQAWTEMTYASFLLVFWILDFACVLLAVFWIFPRGGFALDLGSPIRALARLRPIEGSPIRPHRSGARSLACQWRRAGGGVPLAGFASSLALYLQAAVVMGLVFVIGTSPILGQIVPDMQTEGDFLVEGSGFAGVFSADLLGFIIPTMHHPLLGDLITQSGIGAFDKGQQIYIGFVLLGLLLVALVAGYRRPEIRFWLAGTLVFALLSLGPLITINGQTTGIEGPFTILQSLPFFKANRYPSRYGVMLILSLSVIAGFGLAQLGRRAKPRRSAGDTFPAHTRPQASPPTEQKRRANLRGLFSGAGGRMKPYLLLTLIATIFLFEHLSLPLPQSDMRVPAPYQLIAADRGDFAVLDIPFAWRNGFRITGAPTTQFMFGQFYQTVHRKRLLQGNTSRNPEFKFQYFTDAPILNSLLALETGKTLPPERWETDRAIAAEVLRFFDIKYIVVRPDETGNPAVTPQATIPYIEQILPVEKIHDEVTIKIYRVKALLDQESSLQAGLLIKTGTPLTPLYFGEGWGLLSRGQPIAAQRQEVRLLAPLTGGPQRVTLRMRLPDIYREASQSVFLALNGWQSPAQNMGKEWQEYAFELPAKAVQPGLNDLRLHFAEVTSLPPVGDRTSLTNWEITVLSAGEEVGDFGHIFVNGHEVSPNQRGYNVAMIRPDDQGGMTLRAANFDTHLDPAASEALISFIGAAPPDTLIAVAAADEASLNLSQEAELTLRSIGATGDLRGCFRCSHALIGEAEKPGGRVIEAFDPLRPVGVTTGLGLTEPTVAAVVDWIRIEAVEE